MNVIKFILYISFKIPSFRKQVCNKYEFESYLCKNKYKNSVKRRNRNKIQPEKKYQMNLI